MPDFEELDELKGVPKDPPPPEITKAPSSTQKSKSPEDLLAEAKVLSNLPIGSQDISPGGEGVSDLNIPKSGGGGLGQAIGLFLAAIILVIISGAGGYFLGKNSSVQIASNNSGSMVTVEPSITPQSQVISSPSPSSEISTTGDEVKLASGLTLVLERAWIDSAYSKSKAALPTEAQVNVEVTFANNQSSALSYAPSQFLLKDSRNLEYKPVSSASGGYKPLTLGSLLPGGSVKGGVSFIVPKEENVFKLLYEDAEVIFSVTEVSM